MTSQIVRCNSCRKRFKIPEAMYQRFVKGRMATARCKYCNASIAVDGRVSAKAPVALTRGTLDSVSAVNPPESESSYWVVCLKERDAEMTLPDLRAAIEQTHIVAETLLWRPGMSTWQRVDAIPMLSALLPGRPTDSPL
ncbi:MAG: DUF4339 domain-containing protein [Polyangiaceae bacterium]|nr:DUF4339 domain-containing protein [Polyangiaceae bacterium]